MGNYRNNYGGGYNNRRNNYSGGYNNSYNRGGQGKKKSGAKEGRIRSGKSQGLLCIHAWKANRRHGMVEISAFENSASKHSQSERGHKFVSLAFEVFYKDSGNRMTIWGLYNLTTGKVFLDDLGWVISTKANNGGYVGPIK